MMKNIKVTQKHADSPLYMDTPIGPIQVRSHIEKELRDLTDEELMERAINENKSICVSPEVYAMIERRFLQRKLQNRINPNLGVRI